MPRYTLYLLVTAVLLAGCESDSGQEEATADEPAEEQATGAVMTGDDDSGLPPFPSNDWECSNESAGKVIEWLEARNDMSKQLVTTETAGRVELVERDGDLQIDSYEPVITLEEQRFFIDDRLINRVSHADYDLLTRPIRRAIERLDAEAELMGEEPTTATPLLVIDHRTPFSTINQVLQTVDEAELPTVALMFSKPAPEPTAEAIPEDLKYHLADLHDRESYMSRMDEAREAATTDCPQVAEVFQEAESASVEDRPAILRQGVPQAWIDCECQADIEFLSAYLAWTPHYVMAASVEEFAVDELLEKVEAADGTQWHTLW